MPMSGAQTSCVVLAAGEGKRMLSKRSKVLCEVAFKPMLSWVIDAAASSHIKDICVVASSEDVKSAAEGCEICEQKERLGTGHAVMCAQSFLKGRGGDTLVLCGDAPFIGSGTIERSLHQHRKDNCDVTVIGANIDNPESYGRIIRDEKGLKAIVEARDCTPAQLLVNEVNSGAYWFNTEKLLDALSRLTNNNSQNEYYLTDAVALIKENGGAAGCFTADSPDIVLGANSPADLLLLNERAKQRIVARHLENGVRFISLDGIVIGPDVEIAAGAEIMPGTILYGKTSIGAGSVIGPNSLLENAEVGENVEFNSSQGRDCVIKDGAKIGPFVHLRPDAVIGKKVKLGDFVEVKNSSIGEGTSIAHLTYIGDSDIGKFCNFGCGVVVANYDGEKKNRTVVGDYAFVGCNTNLVPPVTVGSRAYTAAGTTITKDVPDGALAIGRARQENIPDWADKKLKKYIEKNPNRMQKVLGGLEK